MEHKENERSKNSWLLPPGSGIMRVSGPLLCFLKVRAAAELISKISEMKHGRTGMLLPFGLRQKRSKLPPGKKGNATAHNGQHTQSVQQATTGYNPGVGTKAGNDATDVMRQLKRIVGMTTVPVARQFPLRSYPAAAGKMHQRSPVYLAQARQTQPILPGKKEMPDAGMNKSSSDYKLEEAAAGKAKVICTRDTTSTSISGINDSWRHLAAAPMKLLHTRLRRGQPGNGNRLYARSGVMREIALVSAWAGDLRNVTATSIHSPLIATHKPSTGTAYKNGISYSELVLPTTKKKHRVQIAKPQGNTGTVTPNTQAPQNFTTKTTKPRESTSDIRQKVEEVLIELLNSANAI